MFVATLPLPPSTGKRFHQEDKATFYCLSPKFSHLPADMEQLP
jgi:hypothetical protein